MAVTELTEKLVAAKTRIAELEKGLEPLKKIADAFGMESSDDATIYFAQTETINVRLTYGHFRRAAELLKGEKPEP